MKRLHGQASLGTPLKAATGAHHPWMAFLPALGLLFVLVFYVWFRRRSNSGPKKVPPSLDPRLDGVTASMAPEPVRNDAHQAAAWASPYQRNLVVAGAGAGKTALVVKRVELLIARGADPSRFLLLSFNKDAKQQLIDRLNMSLPGSTRAKAFNEWVKAPTGPAVGTIHAVAYELNKRLARKQGRAKELKIAFEGNEGSRSPYFETYKWAFVKWAKVKGGKVREALWAVLEYRRRKSIGDEKVEKLSIQELHEPPVIACSNGIKVRSGSERILVEYFIAQGIRFEYETPVKLSKWGFPFRPDFYLPEVDSFIEFQGMWDHTDLQLRASYRQKIDEKRQQFAKSGLRGACLELFANDLIDESYKEKIKTFIQVRRARKGEVSEQMESALTVKNYLSDVMAKLLIGVSKAMLENVVSVEEAQKRSPDIFRHVYEYAWELRQQADKDFEYRGQIDSGTLLARLADEFENDPAWAQAFWGQFDYLFIDEFQDVQPLLFRFLRSGLESCNFFLIGDDRQAIYRFMGSSPYFIRHLETYFPGTKRYLLKKNYRSNQSVVEVSQQMVPADRERYVSSRGGSSDIHLIWVDDEAEQAEDVLSYVRHHIGEGELLVLSRYKPGKGENPANLSYAKCLRDKDKFLSCHSSKGLEAEAVLVTGLMNDTDSRWPFPAKDGDDLPIKIVKQIGFDEEQSQEEARLFYVALSRAKDHLFLVADRESPSPFIRRLTGLKEVWLSQWTEANALPKPEQDASPTPDLT